MSLFLFFAGVTAFLWTLDITIGIWIICLGSLLCVFYLGCTLVPLWIPQCPTSTPLVHQLRRGILSIGIFGLRAFATALAAVVKAKDRVIPRFLTRQRPELSISLDTGSILPLTLTPLVDQSEAPMPLQDQIAKTIEQVIARRRDRSSISQSIEQRKDELDASALCWIIFDVSDSDAVAVGIQALGAIHPSSPVAARLRPLEPMRWDNILTRSAAGTSLAEAIRVQRSDVCMAPGGSGWRSFGPVLDVLYTSEYPDALALARIHSVTDHGGLNHMASLSLTSTAIHVIRANDDDFSKFLCYLALCDFEEFRSEDWNIVFDALATFSADELRQCVRIRCSSFPPALCLADLLTQALTTLDIFGNDRINTTSAVHHLLRCSLGPEGLSASPFLLEYLASHAMTSQADSRDIQGALDCLLQCSTASILREDVTTSRFRRAVALTLHAALCARRARPTEFLYPWGPAVRMAEAYASSPAYARIILDVFLSSTLR